MNETPNILYHSNSSEPTAENPLLVRAVSANKAQDGSRGPGFMDDPKNPNHYIPNPDFTPTKERPGGFLFASGGELAHRIAIGYAMKGKQELDKNGNLSSRDENGKLPGTMAAFFETLAIQKGIPFFVMNDRDSFLAHPCTSYLYELPSENFRQIRNQHSGALTTEYVSDSNVQALGSMKIQGVDIPLEHGVQIVFLTIPPDEYSSIRQTYDERIKNEGITDPEKMLQVYLGMYATLEREGKIMYENKLRNLPHLDLETGQWIELQKQNISASADPKLAEIIGDLKPDVNARTDLTKPPPRADHSQGRTPPQIG